MYSYAWYYEGLVFEVMLSLLLRYGHIKAWYRYILQTKLYVELLPVMYTRLHYNGWYDEMLSIALPGFYVWLLITDMEWKLMWANV